MIAELANLIEKFQNELGTVDEVSNVLLKGHLLIEETLSRIIDLYLFHREYIGTARLTFQQKSNNRGQQLS